MKFMLGKETGNLILENQMAFSRVKGTEKMFGEIIEATLVEMRRQLPSFINFMTHNAPVFYPSGMRQQLKS